MEINRRRGVQIVIPVRGAHEALRLCLACLNAHTPKLSAPLSAMPVSVTIVCPDDEFEAVSRAEGESVGPWAALIVQTSHPQSFARNCNLGARHDEAEFVVFLNSDAFVGPGWLDALLAPFANPDVVAVGPRGPHVSGHQAVAIDMVMGDSPEWVSRYVGAMWPAQLAAARNRGVAVPDVPYRARRLVGFCLAVRRSAWDAVGGFDEQFENAFCDDDLSLRLSLIGDCVVVPDLLVLHHGSASFAELPDAEESYRRTLLENEGRFNEKWSRRGLLPFLNAWLDSRGAR